MEASACPRCRQRMVVINIDLRGEELTLRACSRCDVRSWVRDGEPTTLDGVLDLAAAR